MNDKRVNLCIDVNLNDLDGNSMFGSKFEWNDLPYPIAIDVQGDLLKVLGKMHAHGRQAAEARAEKP